MLLWMMSDSSIALITQITQIIQIIQIILTKTKTEIIPG